MKCKKRIICIIALVLSVILFSSEVVYATEGMENANVESDNVDYEMESIEEQVTSEDAIEIELSEENGGLITSEDEIIILEDIETETVEEIEALEELETTEEVDEIVEELTSENSEEIIIEESVEEAIDETEEACINSVVTNPYVWTSENFQISYMVTNDWGEGYQCEIVITNIGDVTIEDWNLVLETTDTIDNIWNASIESSEEGVYYIDNMGWNSNILSGGSVSFGFVGSYEGELCIPTFYGVSGTETELAGESYQVTYQVSDLWENGYVGNIVIHNLTDTDLKNWKVKFDLSDNIVNLWNGEITGNEDGQYTVQYASYNAIIPAGGNVTIGFTAEAEMPQIYPDNYTVNVVVHNEMNTSSRDDVIGVAYFEPIKEADVRIADDGIQYAVNQLNIVGTEECTFEQIAALGEEYGFEIVGYIEFTNDYQIKFVNDKTYEELGTLCAELVRLDYILEVNYNMVSKTSTDDIDSNDIMPDVDGYQPSDPLWKSEWGDGEYYYFGTWAVEAINAPQAWEYLDYMYPVKIGVYDNIFMPHEDIKYKKIWGSYDDDKEPEVDDFKHGTSVAGVMAAGFGNGIGIAGVACKHELYAYSYEVDEKEKDIKFSKTIMEDKYALALMIGNGVRVLNFSNGVEANIVFSASGRINDEEAIEEARNYLEKYTNVLESFLVRLIDRGYDFVIVQSAGNANNDYFVEDGSDYGCRVIKQDKDGNILEPIDENTLIGEVLAQYNNFYSYSTILSDRVIVVGSYGCHNNKFYTSKFSNIGSRVDVLAPGENIQSIIPYDEYDDELSGTSYAAPYVSGTAALVYSVNPELSGEQVKEIIVKTATKKISGISAYEEDKSGLGLLVPADNTEYKCLDAGAAVKMALEEKGETPILGENTGFIMGFIGYKESESSDAEIVRDAQVSAYRYSIYDGNVDTDYQYTTISDENGHFELCVDPGTYQLKIYKEGYIPLVIDDVEVNSGEDSYQEPILTVKEIRLKTHFEITGRVEDALNGNAISNADIKFREGWNQKSSSSINTTVLTDANGEYTVKLKGGYYTAEISKDGYITGYINIVVYDNLTVQSAVLSPLLQENEIRIVLTWGEEPLDLDSHMYISDGYTNEHVYYGNKFAYSNGEMICQLDHDDTLSFGPETITLFADKTSTNYKYSVYQFSSRGEMSLSGARVVVYYGDSAPVTYHIPVQQAGRTWEVFVIENGKIIPINKRF